MESSFKKIAFGFKKTIKATPKHEETKQFVDCLEGKSIKVKGSENIEEKKPLCIPMKNKTTDSHIGALLQLSKVKAKGEQEKKLDTNNTDTPGDTIEARAVKELMEEANKANNTTTEKTTSFVVPVNQNISLSGEKESTLDDYENVPIADFGMAMLRGMGWAPGKGIGKHKSVEVKLPTLRPKGMGLGATLTAKAVSEEGSVKSQDELKIIKGSYIRIITGKMNGTYGQVMGFDDDNGRLIIKTALSGENLNLSEFMVTAVNKKEYQEKSKIINNAKFEEYKEKTHRPDVKSFSIDYRRNVKDERERKHDACKNGKQHYKDKSKHYSSIISESDERHSRDKKRKEKKKERDRSRSRNKNY